MLMLLVVAAIVLDAAASVWHALWYEGVVPCRDALSHLRWRVVEKARLVARRRFR